jgi:4-hydroxy-2-oxoheptanedioate aldolase
VWPRGARSCAAVLFSFHDPIGAVLIVNVPQNKLIRNLLAGKVQIGIHSRLPCPYTTEVIAGAGFDWILIDVEHSPTDLESVLRQLHVIAPFPTTPVVHLPCNDAVVIKRFLDIGVQTLLVPNVSTAEEARAAVSYTRYPPAGVRGLANVTRASSFGRVKDYAKKAHHELCLFVMVETQQGLDNLDEICSVEGVDGVFIGPADLHAALGYAGEADNPVVKNAIDDAIRRIVANGKTAGVMAPAEQNARRWMKCGARMVVVGADIRLLSGSADELARTYADR